MNIKTTIIIVVFLIITIIICVYLYVNRRNRNNNEQILEQFNELNIFPEVSKKVNIPIPILYINLDRSPKRKQNIINQMKLFNFSKLHRIRAVDGDNFTDLSRVKLDDIDVTNNCHKLTKYEIACTLSHIKAIIFAWKNNMKYALIVEDDCSFIPIHYLKIDLIRDIINKKPKDCNIIQLHTQKCFNIEPKITFMPHNEHKPCLSALSYIINRDGMKDILTYVGYLSNKHIILNCSYGRSEADHFLYNNTTSYWIPYNICIQKDFNSTISLFHDFGFYVFGTKKHKEINNYTIFKYYTHNKISKQVNYAKALLDMNNYLNSLGIKYILFSGTLLGFYRNGSFIQHDYDIDLGVRIEDYNPIMENGNSKIKFKLTKGTPKFGYLMKFTHIQTNIPIDIFFFYKEHNYLWHSTSGGKLCKKSKYKMCRWKIPEYNRKQVSYLNNNFYIPDSTEQYLENFYGPNWNIPKKYGYLKSLKINRGLLDTYQEPINESKISNLWPQKIKSFDKPLVWKWSNKNFGTTREVEHFEKYLVINLNSKNILHLSRYINSNKLSITEIIKNILFEYGGFFVIPDNLVLNETVPNVISNITELSNTELLKHNKYVGNICYQN